MRRCLVLLAPLVLGACGEEPIIPIGPIVLSTAIEPSDQNVLSAAVRVTASGFDSAAIRFWADGVAALRSPGYRFGADSVAVVPVLGMRARETYQVELLLYDVDGERVEDTLSFDTGALPLWVPSPGVAGADTTPGVLLLSLADGAVAVNNEGAVVWYRAFDGGVLSSFQAHPNGLYTALGNVDTLRQFRVLDETGTARGTIGCVGFDTRFHAVRMEADGSYWILCDEVRRMDLSAVGGLAAADVQWTVLQHVLPDSTVALEWHSADHFSPADIPAGLVAGDPVNATHGNAIDFDRNGNVLLSFRSLNEVTSIDRTSGAVRWRFGGLASQFTLINDTKGSFERQHGLRAAAPGQVQFLDNGSFPPSRLVRYQLDPVGGTAVLVMDFRDAPTTFTSVGGSTQYYADGTGLVTFGREGRVIEVDVAGQRRWELTGIDGTYVFRAQRLPSLYGRTFGDPVGR